MPPPQQPGLNPSDCNTVWGAVQQLVCQHQRLTTISQLKQAIVTECMGQTVAAFH